MADADQPRQMGSIGRDIAAAVVDELLSRGLLVLGRRKGGLRRERYINLVMRVAMDKVGQSPPLPLSDQQAIFYHLAGPLLETRRWHHSLPHTNNSVAAVERIDAALLRAAKLANA